MHAAVPACATLNTETRSSMRYISLVFVFSLVMLSCGGEEPGPRPELRQDEDSLSRHRSLVPADSIGIELGDSNYVFGTIDAADFTEDGRILALDRSARTVKMYTPEGEFLARIGREGSGPGEFQNPRDMTVLGNGLMAVTDPWAGSVKLFHPDTGFVREIGGFFPSSPMEICGAGDRTFVGLKREMDVEDSMLGYTFALWGYDGEPVIEYATELDSFDPTLMGPRMTETSIVYASDNEGRIYFSRRSTDEYVVTGVDSAGDTLLTVEQDYEPVRKTSEEIAEEKDDFYDFLQRRAASGGRRDGGGMAAGLSPEDVHFEPDPYRFAITSLGVDGDGSIWVRRGWETRPVFDVWSPSGGRLYTASFADGRVADALSSCTFEVTPHGLLAYDPDPEEGFPRLFVVEAEERQRRTEP